MKWFVPLLFGLVACDPNIRIGGLGDGGAGSRVPAQLPARLLVGLNDDGGTWMPGSGVAWDVRWSYFTSRPGSSTGWYNNWAGGALTEDYATTWFQSVTGQGYIPGIQYYLLEPDYSPSGSSQVITAKLQVPSVMKDYFSKFRLLMQAAKKVAGPVIVMLEASAMGQIDQQANHDPDTYAAIADSGLSELAGLPNTVAGFGLAYLAVRQSVGAGNVLLGLVVEPNASQSDFLNHEPNDEVAPHVSFQYSFLSHLGLTANATGQTYDFLANCPCYQDADQYTAQGVPGFWWDASDQASVLSASFNRYAQWLTSFNQTAKLPWVLWQVPMGNSNSPNVDNKQGAWAGPYPTGYTLPTGCTTGSKTGCPGGYKDNRAEYFLGVGRDAHLSKFAAAGVIGVFFGAASGSTDQTADYYSDGQLFMKSRGADLLNHGGFPLSR